MAAVTYRVTGYDGAVTTFTVGTGDHALSRYAMDGDLDANVRFSHVLYTAAKREGKATGTFEEFLECMADLSVEESGEPTAPPD